MQSETHVQNVRLEQNDAELLNALLRHVPTPVYAKNDALQWVYANPAACALFNRSRQELVGNAANDVFPEDTPHHDMNIEQHALETGKTTVFGRHIEQQGRRVAFIFKAQSVELAPGGERFLIVHARDARAPQKKNSRTMRDEARFQLLYRLSQLQPETTDDIARIALAGANQVMGAQRPSESANDCRVLLFSFSSGHTAYSPYAASAPLPDPLFEQSPPPLIPISSAPVLEELVRRNEPVFTYFSPQSQDGAAPGRFDFLTGEHALFVPISYEGRLAAAALAYGAPRRYTKEQARQLTLLIEGMWRIIQQQLTKERLSSRERLLEAASSVADALLRHRDWRAGAADALALLGRATNVSHVLLFQHLLNDRGAPTMQGRQAWSNTPQVSALDPDILNATYEDAGLRRWLRKLSQRNNVHGITDGMPKKERSLLQSVRALSVAAIPIFIHETLWGGLLFLDCEQPRTWAPVELETLDIAAGVLGGAIIRTQAEQELLEAKLNAEKANQLKSQIVFNVSHDFRTPLNSILGFSEAILTAPSLEHSKQFAGHVLHESENLLSLINSLLDIARLESGNIELSESLFDPAELLQQLMNSARPQVNEKRLNFSLRIEDNMPEQVLGDAVRVKQIIANLLFNAIKFTRQGDVAIHARMAGKVAEWARIVVTITDTGVGIPPDKQEAIFQPFVQVDSDTTRKEGGAGLGAAISRQLAELMGGAITLKSSPGKGSAFRVILPLRLPGAVSHTPATSISPSVTAPEDSLAQSESFLEKPEKPLAVTRHGNILLVEDYPPNQALVQVILESAGHELTIAQSGSIAVELCQGRGFDLILMDIQMPEMDGYEATRRIRDGAHCAKIPILALSANADKESCSRAIEAGMNDLLSKPIRRNTLLSTINAWLENPSQLPRSVACEQHDLTPQTAQPASKHGDNVSEPEQAPPPLAYEKALHEFNGQKKIMDRLVKDLLNRIHGHLQAMNDAIKDDDPQSLAREAHQLKGGALSLCADGVAKAAKNLEKCARAGQMHAAPALVEELKKQYIHLDEYVQELGLFAAWDE